MHKWEWTNSNSSMDVHIGRTEINFLHIFTNERINGNEYDMLSECTHFNYTKNYILSELAHHFISLYDGFLERLTHR